MDDVQVELFNVDEEAQLARTATWRQLPEGARAAVSDLFAALAVEHLQSTNKKERMR